MQSISKIFYTSLILLNSFAICSCAKHVDYPKPVVHVTKSEPLEFQSGCPSTGDIFDLVEKKKARQVGEVINRCLTPANIHNTYAKILVDKYIFSSLLNFVVAYSTRGKFTMLTIAAENSNNFSNKTISNIDKYRILAATDTDYANFKEFMRCFIVVENSDDLNACLNKDYILHSEKYETYSQLFRP